jgi:hypothetical protein
MAIQTDRPPYEAYAAIMGTFVAGLAATGGLARVLRPDPREHTNPRPDHACRGHLQGGTWTAAGLGVAQVLAPGVGRILTWTLSPAAANDFLQAGFSALTAKSNELAERA